MRRAFRRGMRREIRRELRRGFAPDIPPMLQRANELLAIGQYAEAAEAFEQMARGAQARGGPRAGLLYAGRQGTHHEWPDRCRHGTFETQPVHPGFARRVAAGVSRRE